MKLLLITFLAVACSGSAWATKFEDCGSVDGQVSSVDVSGCDSGDTCTLKRNTDVSIGIKFKSKVKSSSVKVVVQGVIGGIPLPFNFPQSNGCEKSGLTCPLSESTDYAYASSLHVADSYPPLAVVVKFQLQDEAGKDLACVLIPSQIA